MSVGWVGVGGFVGEWVGVCVHKCVNEVMVIFRS